METRTVPRSVKEIIDKYASSTISEVVTLHKDDGTICRAGISCKREHEIYAINYIRTSIQKGTSSMVYLKHYDCPHVKWSLKCPRTYEMCEKCLVYKNRAEEESKQLKVCHQSG